MSNIKENDLVEEVVISEKNDNKIREELSSLREQIEVAKSELYLMRMTPLDNRSKSFSSDKKKYKISIRKAKSMITSLLSGCGDDKEFI